MECILENLVLDVVPNEWDSPIFGFDVWDCRLNYRPGSNRSPEFGSFENQIAGSQRPVLLVAKVPASDMVAINSLQRSGFQFRDLSLKPRLDLHQAMDDYLPVGTRSARQEDLAELMDIASQAFQVSRYHADPDVGYPKANLRYRRWVESAMDSQTQELVVCEVEGQTIGFFVQELLQDHMYWHLTAIKENQQGKGYGYRTWRSLMTVAHSRGCNEIRTSISALNLPVLNLYRKLGAEFNKPEVTLHKYLGT